MRTNRERLMEQAPFRRWRMATLQKGNTAPRVKVHPKDSSQIQGNYLGVTTSRMPRSAANDYLPVEAIRLIDRVTDCE